MTRSTRTPADVPDHVGEAKATLHKLWRLWPELWDQQYDPPWRPEDANVSSGKPGSRLLHPGTPQPLQKEYLHAQRAIRDAWRLLGGRWIDDGHQERTRPPALMRRVTELLIDALERHDDEQTRQACKRIRDGWTGLSEGVRGEAKGGARRCTHCTDPAEKGRTKCGRHKYVANRDSAA